MVSRSSRLESRLARVIAAIVVCSMVGIASVAVAQVPAAAPAPAAPAPAAPVVAAPAPAPVAAPAEVPAPVATAAPAPIATTARPKSKPKAKPKHHIVVETSDEVEPAHALVKLKDDTWVYSRPNQSSHHVAQVHMDKFVNVTGSTHYYLRVQLKGGKVGYITPESVELTRPMDRTFFLTSDSPVYNRPNRWGRKVSEVHKGHAVHVVGVALEYMKIRMKDGLEGFIPSVALE